MNKVVLMGLSVLLFTGNARVWADGECTERPVTAEEKQFYGLFDVMRTALPNPPAGWNFNRGSQEYLDKNYKFIPDVICKESQPTLSLQFYYERMSSEEDQVSIQKMGEQAPDAAKLAQV